MFWRRTPVDESTKPEKLSTILPSLTKSWRLQRDTRIIDMTDKVYPVVRSHLVAYATSNNSTLWYKNVVELSENLALMSCDERDEVLVKVRDMLREEGLECHIDGTCMKVIWNADGL